MKKFLGTLAVLILSTRLFAQSNEPVQRQGRQHRALCCRIEWQEGGGGGFDFQRRRRERVWGN
jgi:hypothetical protein